MRLLRVFVPLSLIHIFEIADGDYALWYRDLSEEPKKYDGKTVEYKGLAAVNPRMKPGVFFFGRQLMTCCVEDIQFAGLLTQCAADAMPENGKCYTCLLYTSIRPSDSAMICIVEAVPMKEHAPQEGQALCL